MKLEEYLKDYRRIKHNQNEAMIRKHYSFALSMNKKLNYLSRKIDRCVGVVEITKWRA